MEYAYQLHVSLQVVNELHYDGLKMTSMICACYGQDGMMLTATSGKLFCS